MDGGDNEEEGEGGAEEEGSAEEEDAAAATEEGTGQDREGVRERGRESGRRGSGVSWVPYAYSRRGHPLGGAFWHADMVQPEGGPLVDPAAISTPISTGLMGQQPQVLRCVGGGGGGGGVRMHARAWHLSRGARAHAHAVNAAALATHMTCV